MYSSLKIAFRFGVIVVLGSLASCRKPEAEPSDEPTPAIAPSTPPRVAQTPSPVTILATPEPNYFAPPGIYYLTAAASVETSDGIVGLKPGTRLQKVAPGKYSADGHEVALRESQVTNDLRIAQQAAGADHAAQMALRQAMEAAAAKAAQTARDPVQATPAATPNTVVATGQPSRPTTTRPRGANSSLGQSGALSKTRTQDGWIWQMDANGNWQPIRPAN